MTSSHELNFYGFQGQRHFRNSEISGGGFKIVSIVSVLIVNVVPPNIAVKIPMITQTSNTSCSRFMNQPKIVRKTPEL